MRDQRVHIHELDHLAVVSVKHELAHKLGDAKLFDHVEYVDLRVETTLALMEDLFLLGHPAFSSATAAVEPATEAIDI